jgi:hypothetical protein
MRLFEGIRTLRWQSWDGTGLEHCTIRSDGLEFLAEGVVIMPREDGAALRYALRFDGAWRTQSVSVAVLGREESITLTMDGQGMWQRDGAPMPALNYALAPDISASPITNTFAIKRLNLAQGESADIETAYFDLPDLSIHADPQRYTCMEAGRIYRYQSRDSDFEREIEVDHDGFVVTYPGLFRRLE